MSNSNSSNIATINKQTTTGEVWKDVAGYEGRYQVSDQGRVKSMRRVVSKKVGKPKTRGYSSTYTVRERILKPGDAGGRLIVGLHKDGVSEYRSVHTLVLETFVGPRPSGLEGCHRDDDFTNNCVSNLRWDTHKANCEDRVRNGRDYVTNNKQLNRTRMLAGWGRKMDRWKAEKLRKLADTGEYTQQQLGDMFGISQVMAGKIARRECWNL